MNTNTNTNTNTNVLPLIEVDIRWEDTGEEVHNLLVSQWDGDYPDNDSDAIFYYGLTWAEVQDCIKNKKIVDGQVFPELNPVQRAAAVAECMAANAARRKAKELMAAGKIKQWMNFVARNPISLS